MLDDVDDDAVTALTEAAREVASRPALVVAITADADLAEQLSVAEHLALGPLDADAIAAIAALYAPATRRSPSRSWPSAAAACRGARIGSRPTGRAREAARRLRAVADRTAAERSDLRRAESSSTGTVVELQAVRERAELREVDGGAERVPVQGARRRSTWATPTFFFGRERLVAEMVARLVGAPLLGVVGASGSGKSSALRAGLLAGARGRRAAGQRGLGTACCCAPASIPLRSARARGRRAATPASGAACRRRPVRGDLHALPRRGRARGVRRRARRAGHGRRPTGGRRRSPLRADFYGRCAAYPELARLLGANHVLVGPMQRDELRRAIELPAQRAGLRVEPELVDRLLADVEGEPGALPLLSTALLELWQERDGRRLRARRLRAHRRRARRGRAPGRGGLRPPRPRAAGRRAPHPAAARRRGRRRRRGAPARRARRARRRPRRRRRVLDVLADGRLVHAQRRHGGGRARGAAARVAAAARLARGGRRGPATAPPPGRSRRASGTPAARDPGELYRGARLASTLDWSAEHARRAQRGRARVRRRRAAAQSEREARARAAHQPAPARAAGRRRRAAGRSPAGAGVLFLDQRGTARGEARTADGAAARRAGARRGRPRPLAAARAPGRRARRLAPDARQPARRAHAQPGRDRRHARRGQPAQPDRAAPRRPRAGRRRRARRRHVPRPGHAPRRCAVRTDAHRSTSGSSCSAPTARGCAVGGFGAIHLLDGHTFRRIAALDLPGHDIQFINVAFSPDGRELVAMYEQATAAAGDSPCVRSCCASTGARAADRVGVDRRTGLAGRRRRVRTRRALADHRRRAPRRSSRRQNARLVLHGRAIVAARPAHAAAPAPLPGLSPSPARCRPTGARSPSAARTARSLPRPARPAAPGPPRAATTRAVRRRAVHARRALPGDRRRRREGHRLGRRGRHGGRDVRRSRRPRASASPSTAGARTLYTAARRRHRDHVGPRRATGAWAGRSTSGRTSATTSWRPTISRDGRTLAMQQADGTVSVVDLATLRRRTVAIAGRPRAAARTPYAPAFGPRRNARRQRRRRLARARRRPHRARSWPACADITTSSSPRRPAPTGASWRAPARTGRCGSGTRAPSARSGAPIRLDGGAAGDAAISPDGTQGRRGGLRRHGRRVRRPLAPATRAPARRRELPHVRRLLARRPAAARRAARTATYASSRRATCGRSARPSSRTRARSPASTSARTTGRS